MLSILSLKISKNIIIFFKKKEVVCNANFGWCVGLSGSITDAHDPNRIVHAQISAWIRWGTENQCFLQFLMKNVSTRRPFHHISQVYIYQVDGYIGVFSCSCVPVKEARILFLFFFFFLFLCWGFLSLNAQIRKIRRKNLLCM